MRKMLNRFKRWLCRAEFAELRREIKKAREERDRALMKAAKLERECSVLAYELRNAGVR